MKSLSNPIGVLLVNLGTPAHCTAGAIRSYLNEFLSDKRVVELPVLLWQPILKGFVLPFRPSKLVSKYREIWMEGGSPLWVYTQRQCQALAEQLRDENVMVAMAMRYGEPNLAKVIKALQEQGCERILLVPMYPQYAASTTATLFDKVADVSKTIRNQPDYRFIKRFAEHPDYIHSLASKVMALWEEQGLPDRLLLSFHGLPQKSIDLGDPYQEDCKKTAACLQAYLSQYQVSIDVSFQSRFGNAKWISPATQSTLESYPSQGIKRVDVMCPGFVADCLETLEEIQIGCARAFKAKGGERFRYIPCLNDDPLWIKALATIVKSRLGAWEMY